MLTTERVKQILNDPTLEDQQIEEIRDNFHALAELIYQDWLDKNKSKI